MRCSIAASLSLILSLLGLPGTLQAATAVYKEGSPDPFTSATYTGAEDTMVLTQGGNSTDNFGIRQDFSAGRRNSGPGTAHALIRFSITSLAGQFAAINSVTLRLFTSFTQIPVGVSETMEVHRVVPANAGWVEGNGHSFTGFGPEDVGGSTWSYRVQGASAFSGTPWAGSAGASTPGTDFQAAILASNSFNSATPSGSAHDFVFNDVSFIAAWAAGSNEGLLLKIPIDTVFPDRREWIWHSSESPSASLRPELIIDYRPSSTPTSKTTWGRLKMLYGSEVEPMR